MLYIKYICARAFYTETFCPVLQKNIIKAAHTLGKQCIYSYIGVTSQVWIRIDTK